MTMDELMTDQLQRGLALYGIVATVSFKSTLTQEEEAMTEPKGSGNLRGDFHFMVGGVMSPACLNLDCNVFRVDVTHVDPHNGVASTEHGGTYSFETVTGVMSELVEKIRTHQAAPGTNDAPQAG